MQAFLKHTFLLTLSVGAATAAVVLSHHVAVSIDEGFDSTETVLPVQSLHNCVASCSDSPNCSIVHFDNGNSVCNHVDQDSVTLDNPATPVFVNTIRAPRGN